MRMLKAMRLVTLLLSIFLLLIGVRCSFVCAADVVAPSKDKTFTLTVKNIGSIDMEGVNVSAQSTNNLITVKASEPSNATITKEGGSQEFKIKFDVGCPPQGSTTVVTAKFNFEISTTTQGPFYQKDCGVGASCKKVDAEFTIEENFPADERCTTYICDPNGGIKKIDVPGCANPDDK